MNDINRRFTAWLSGYYEDFQTMRVIPEGEDYAESSFFTNRRDSHAGNTMAVQAYNNSRFTFDYLTRSFTALVPIPLMGSAAANAAASLHNEGPSQWLTHDPNRIGNSFYEGRASLTYPDTIGDAASLRTFAYPRRADYSHFASGLGTQNSYWVRQGDTDSTYERSGFNVDATHGDPYGATSTRGYGKFKIDVSLTQPDDDSGVPLDRATSTGFDRSNYRKHKVMMNSSLCGVYLGETGEVAFQSSSIGLPYAYLYPIKSPSGKPFFRNSISRRYADWVSANVSATGAGKNQYNFANGSNFNNVGQLGSDDQWFPRNIEITTVVATGQTYNAGVTSITLPASLPAPPPVTRILDPTIDQHLPNKTSGTPTQIIQVGTESKEYSAVTIGGTGDVTFTLTTPLAGTQIQPSVQFYRWANQTAGDTTIQFYNLTTGGTPTPAPIWQYRQDVSDGQGFPELCVRNAAGTVLMTGARTRNGANNTPTFNITSNTSLGYTYHVMTITLASGHSGFVADPQYFAARDPFFAGFGNVYGRIAVGDYLTKENSNLPEKITAINSNGVVETDGIFGGVTGSVYVRQATIGSGNGVTGRPIDGMFGFQPVIVGDTELNAQTDGERFTIRLAHQSFDRTASAVPGQVDASFMLSVGYNRNEAGFELNERGNMVGSKAAITHLFRPVNGTGVNAARQTQFNMFENGVVGKSTYTMDQLWYDIDIVVDFTAQAYYVFCDGTMVGPGSFNAKTDGSAWTADDFYGWSLGVHFQSGRDLVDFTGWQTMVTMIDRVGYIYALQDRMTHGVIPSNIQQDDVIIDKFKVKSMVDGMSQLEINIDDDDDLVNLPQLVSGRPNWKMLIFRDNDYRPIFQHVISNVNFKQSAKKKSKEIILKGHDALGELDFQFPYFDIGQENGMPSLVAAYRRYEITNYADIFHFGTTSLLNLNAFLGLDEDSKGSTGEYLPRYDQRMRLYSSHPIQMYSNENTNGPNYSEDNWEVSRRIDHFKPDPNDATKTRAVFTSDAIKWSEDQIPAGVQVAIKGNWRNVGIGGATSSAKSTPNIGEKGFLTCHAGSFNQEVTPHNNYRGLWTTEQAQSVVTFDAIAAHNSLIVADTSLFPASGTVKIGGTGTSYFNSVTKSYSSKNATTLFLTTTLGTDIGAGTVVRETTATDYVIIDKEWNRSLVITKLESSDGTVNGFLKMHIAPDPTQVYEDYELMGGTGFANARSVLAKNDKMTPTIAPNDDLFRIYIQPNATGAAHNTNVALLPSQVYTTSSVPINNTTTGYAEVITTTPVNSLPGGLSAALASGAITLGAGAGGLADGLECDLAYMTFPKTQDKGFSLRNVGSSYNYRNAHTRWIRDIPQSLWFQKTFGNIREYPYGANSWREALPGGNGALTQLVSTFNAASDTTISVADVSNFPFAGVCELWTNNPNPLLTNSEQAIMLTSFTYSGKDFTTNQLQNVKFADPNKGVIATTGGAGTRTVICRNIDGDYKHCFILFADMRNDGSADADGGTRKTDFGLLHPIQQNYKVQVIWADTGKKFVDLKLGADCDLWQLNAQNDPSTGTAWSDNATAIMLDYNDPAILIGDRSDQTELSTFYHNWEDKAGAFVVVDLSKFFNLNTEANLGRVGQGAGGMKQLGEYLVKDQGEPTLIDNYHYHASAS